MLLDEIRGAKSLADVPDHAARHAVDLLAFGGRSCASMADGRIIGIDAAQSCIIANSTWCMPLGYTSNGNTNDLGHDVAFLSCSSKQESILVETHATRPFPVAIRASGP